MHDLSPSARMHNLSRATARALARLLEDEASKVQDGQDEVTFDENEIALFVEEARIKLLLDNSMLVAAVMFAQPLVQKWPSNWRFAYAVAVLLGLKFNSDGVYAADIIEHWTDEFSLNALKAGERRALKDYDWGNMEKRARSFRAALLHVALESPLPGPFAAQPIVLAGEEPPAIHILVVDDSTTVLEQHRSLVEYFSPSAKIHTCGSAAAALEYFRVCEGRGEQIHLVLLDLELNEDDAMVTGAPITSHADQQVLINHILSKTNGFEVANYLEDAETNRTIPAIDFTFRPLIAMVTSHAGLVTATIPQHVDGSVNGCDVLLPKPMTADWARVLVECCVI